MTEPAVYPFVLIEEADFYKEITYKDDVGVVVLLAGGVAVMTITSDEVEPSDTITLSTAGGSDGTITLANTAPNIKLNLPAAVLTGLTWENGNYDIYITPAGGKKIRFMEGPINLRQRIV